MKYRLILRLSRSSPCGACPQSTRRPERQAAANPLVIDPLGTHKARMRLFNGVLAFLAVVVCAGLFLLSFAYFKGQQIDEAAARLTLYRTTLESEIRHFRHLPVHLSLDAEVAEGLTAPEDQGLNRRLARFAQSAGIDAIYLMDGTGLTISASNASTPAPTSSMPKYTAKILPAKGETVSLR